MQASDWAPNETLQLVLEDVATDALMPTGNWITGD